MALVFHKYKKKLDPICNSFLIVLKINFQKKEETQ